MKILDEQKVDYYRTKGSGEIFYPKSEALKVINILEEHSVELYEIEAYIIKPNWTQPHSAENIGNEYHFVKLPAASSEWYKLAREHIDKQSRANFFDIHFHDGAFQIAHFHRNEVQVE